MRIIFLFALLPAMAGVVLGGIAWFKPETGVAGTPGALLAAVGALFVAVGIILTMTSRLSGRASWILKLLTGLGAALTAIAAWFLMQYAFAIAMTLALLGLALAITRSSQRSAA